MASMNKTWAARPFLRTNIFSRGGLQYESGWGWHHGWSSFIDPTFLKQQPRRAATRLRHSGCWNAKHCFSDTLPLFPPHTHTHTRSRQPVASQLSSDYYLRALEPFVWIKWSNQVEPRDEHLFTAIKSLHSAPAKPKRQDNDEEGRFRCGGSDQSCVLRLEVRTQKHTTLSWSRLNVKSDVPFTMATASFPPVMLLSWPQRVHRHLD